MVIRCEVCLGKKRLIGLGMIEKKCMNCKGVGHLIIDEEKDVENVKPITTNERIECIAGEDVKNLQCTEDKLVKINSGSCNANNDSITSGTSKPINRQRKRIKE